MPNPPQPPGEEAAPSCAQALARAPGPGDVAPDFAFSGGGGRWSRLAELRGSPVVLAFHPPGWDPARAEYVAAYNRLVARVPGAAGGRLLGVGGDGAWHELALADDAVAIPVVCADELAVACAYGVAGRTAVVVVDAAGTIRWRRVADGAAPAHPDALARARGARRPGRGDRRRADPRA